MQSPFQEFFFYLSLSIHPMHRMNKPLIRFLQSEQVQKHQQERVGNPANRLQQPPLPILAGNGESQRRQQQDEYSPPLTGRWGRA